MKKAIEDYSDRLDEMVADKRTDGLKSGKSVIIHEGRLKRLCLIFNRGVYAFWLTGAQQKQKRLLGGFNSRCALKWWQRTKDLIVIRKWLYSIDCQYRYNFINFFNQ